MFQAKTQQKMQIRRLLNRSTQNGFRHSNSSAPQCSNILSTPQKGEPATEGERCCGSIFSGWSRAEG